MIVNNPNKSKLVYSENILFSYKIPSDFRIIE